MKCSINPIHSLANTKSLTVCASVIVSLSLWHAGAFATEPDLGAIAQSCTEPVLSDAVPGAAVSIVVDGELVFEQGYGTKETQGTDYVDTDTLFRPGSAQKMMTAAAVLAQRDQGLLDLSDRLSHWVPEPQFSGRWKSSHVELKHLLNHTAGIPANIEDINCGGDDNSLSEWAASLTGTRLFSRPGAIWNYSNWGYALAGLVAERAAGMPYRHVMTEQVWQPSGMFQTFQTTAEAVAYANVTNGHIIDPDSGEVISLPADAYECWWLFPTGDAFTTAGDMARWSIMLMNGGGDTLSAHSANEILSPSVKTEYPDGGAYGFGTDIMDINGTRVVSHGGLVTGWNANQIMIPEDNFSVSALTNGEAGAGPISKCVLEGAKGLTWPEWGSEKTPPRSWRKYTGMYSLVYYSGERAPAFVYLRQHKLYILTRDTETNEWFTVEARQSHQNTFYVDLDGDNEPTGDEFITFIEGKRRHSRRPEMWARSLGFVGTRRF